VEITDNNNATAIENKTLRINWLPIARISSLLPSYEVDEKIIFDAKDSSDNESSALRYSWDFDNDGIIDSGARKAAHAYSFSGQFRAELEVTDENNASNSTYVDLSIGEPNSESIAEPLQPHMSTSQEAETSNAFHHGDFPNLHTNPLRGENEYAKVVLFGAIRSPLTNDTKNEILKLKLSLTGAENASHKLVDQNNNAYLPYSFKIFPTWQLLFFFVPKDDLFKLITVTPTMGNPFSINWWDTPRGFKPNLPDLMGASSNRSRWIILHFKK
jgi:PKD repeat protein